MLLLSVTMEGKTDEYPAKPEYLQVTGFAGFSLTSHRVLWIKEAEMAISHKLLLSHAQGALVQVAHRIFPNGEISDAYTDGSRAFYGGTKVATDIPGHHHFKEVVWDRGTHRVKGNVLFVEGSPFAVVHLTYVKHSHGLSVVPHVQLFELEDVVGTK